MKEDFSYKIEWAIEPSIFNNQAIELTTRDMAGRITKEILNTKEEMIRQGLIKLGWLPPEQVNDLHKQLDIAESFISSDLLRAYKAECEDKI